MIYYLEDDKNIRELVVYTLNQSGLIAQGYDNGVAFYDALEEELPELVLLDIMLPGEDGISILKRLREDGKTAGLPVMMITAKGSEYDKVVGLDSGADDYLAKPFGMMELVARVRALLRRTGKAKEEQILRSGDLALDVQRHQVWAGGRALNLTHKEFELLQFLMENVSIVFDREHLLEMVWGYDYAGGSRTVDVHVQTLRSKLGELGWMIQTVRGVGYRLTEKRDG